MRTLFLLALIGFNLGWSISNYNDDLERIHEQKIRNEVLRDSIKIYPIKKKYVRNHCKIKRTITN